MSAIPLDPLIAEAKDRARRRRLLALVAVVVVVAAAAGMTYEFRSSGNSLGVCATVPSGWQERTVTAFGPPTVVLTNFRFGRMGDVFGITDPRLDWPANGVLIAVGNWPPDSTVSRARLLRVTRPGFAGMEGSARPTAHFGVRSQGRILDTYVTVGALTSATIAAANRALAGVRTCSA